MFFRYDAALIARYPGVIGGLLWVQDIAVGGPDDRLAALYQAEQAAVKARLGGDSLSDLPSLQAWRSAFRGFGVEPTQYRCAAEALLRRLTKKGDIPAINPLVDIGNLVSIRYALPVAVFDKAGVAEGIRVHFAQGDEPFQPLGEAEDEYPAPGEVVFTDTASRDHARRWCWRQSAQSAAQAGTRSALVTVEAHHAGGTGDVQAALADLRDLFETMTGAQCRATVVTAAVPEASE